MGAEGEVHFSRIIGQWSFPLVNRYRYYCDGVRVGVLHALELVDVIFCPKVDGSWFVLFNVLRKGRPLTSSCISTRGQLCMQPGCREKGGDVAGGQL